MSLTLRRLSLLLAISCALALTAPVRAAENDDVYREGTGAAKMVHKLGRGVVNFFTGWVEVPKNVVKRWKQYDPITGIVMGGLEGIVWGFGRTVTGVYDVFTFPLAIPQDYQPLMEPEFILPAIWGEPLPFMEPVSGLKPLTP